MSRILAVSPRLPVASLDRTIRFYSEMLGFHAGPLWPAEAPTFVILDGDAAALQFYAAGPDTVVGEATISLEVDDALALHERVRPHVAIEWGPEVYWYGRREFSFRDPDGYAIIVSEVTADPPTDFG